MIIFETVAVAFSMFSAIPMPQFPWNRRNMRFALCAFPLVGIVIGCAQWGVCTVGSFLGLPQILMGALYCLVPVLLTGGIHLDGYADTCDALASHAGAERKQEIMKDANVGAFAVIRLCGSFILVFAMWAALPSFRPLPILLGFVLSRIQSALAVAAFPLAKDTGLAHAFAEAADRRAVCRMLTVLDVLVSAGLCLCGMEGVAMALVSQTVFLYYRCVICRQFGGLSGDLAGWFLVQAEKWMLAALVLSEYLEVLF